MDRKQAEQGFDSAYGEVIELSKPRFQKRFVYLPVHPVDAMDFITFVESLPGVKATYVPAFGKRMRVTRARRGELEPLFNMSDVHYVLPMDHTRMVIELIAYYDGDKHVFDPSHGG